jgi:hypothetical protein
MHLLSNYFDSFSISIIACAPFRKQRPLEIASSLFKGQILFAEASHERPYSTYGVRKPCLRRYQPACLVWTFIAEASQEGTYSTFGVRKPCLRHCR